MKLITAQNKTAKNVMLTVPEHVSWKFDGELYSAIKNEPTSTFEFSYALDLAKLPDITFKQAVDVSLLRYADMKLAICVSGADSEIIAIHAAKLGLDFELYFLDIWGTNIIAQEKVKTLAHRLGVKLNVISLAKEHAYAEVIPVSYYQLQAEKPTYLCLPYLLERIPASMMIIGGEGDPQKSGPDYEPYANLNGLYSGLPISATEVFYRQWALLHDRAAEMYFYASTPELIQAYWNHPLLQKRDRRIDTRTLVDFLYPELLFSSKTTNWEHKQSENYDIRAFLRTLSTPYKRSPAVCLVT